MKHVSFFKQCVGAVLVIAACAAAKPPSQVKVLISMLPTQAEFFETEVLKPFEKKEKIKIEAERYSNVDSLTFELQKHQRQVCVVKVPFDKASSLVDQGLVRPLEDFLTADELKGFNDTYLLGSLGRIDGKQYYMPRKFETRIVVYLKSRVAEAVLSFSFDSAAVSAALKKYNGFGLPTGYTLEENPEAWDFYDVFTAGWIWANTAYDGKKAGRIGHRGRKYSGTALRVIDRAFSLGADSAQIVNMNGQAVTDAFYWEAIYAASGCYSVRMMKEQWSGAGVWEGFKDGDVFFSFMTQLDCFMIHGTGRDGIDGFISNPDDLGYAIMPAGCSFELNSAGVPAYEGSHAISTGGWWWGIPADFPEPRAGYNIICAITNTTNQVQESNRFGMVPVRKDILSDMSMLFGGGWITNMYNVSFKQLMANKKTVLPAHPKFDRIRSLWLDAWIDIVMGKNWSNDRKSPDRRFIEKKLKEKYRVMAAGLQ
jgi:maltose-binding protein MalE